MEFNEIIIKLKPYYHNDNVLLYWDDCLKLMPELIKLGIKFHAIICDPPFQITACDWDVMIPFETMWENIKQLRYDKSAVALFGSEPFSSKLRMSNLKEFKYDWIWEKEKAANFVLAKYQPMKFHEIISVFFNHNFYPIKYKNPNKDKRLRNQLHQSSSRITPLASGKNINSKDYSNLYNYPKSIIKFKKGWRKIEDSHPTQKPLELIKYLIKTYTKENELVLDFCSGSSTLGAACINLNRKCILIEKKQKYCDLSVERLEHAFANKNNIFHLPDKENHLFKDIT